MWENKNMNEQEFQTKLAELMGEISTLPAAERAKLEQLADETRQRHERLKQTVSSLQESLDCEAVLITRGSRGMALFDRGADSPLYIPVSGTDQVADVTGAGDTVIATFTLALAAGASFAEAAKLANYGGGIVVMKMGTATVSNDELRRAVERDEALPE